MKPIGRSDFAFRLLFLTVVASIFQLLMGVYAQFHNVDIPRAIRILLESGMFCLIGINVAKAIDGRLSDIGRSRLFGYPAFAVWLLATSLPFVSAREWPIALALFLILLLVGTLSPSEHAREGVIPVDTNIIGKNAPALQYAIPARLLIGPIGFLRTLLTFACLGIPLIWLENGSRQRLAIVFCGLSFAILYFVWLTKVLGRFADSGLSSNLYWFGFCVTSTFVSALPLRFYLLNRYETLVLFLLIQIPLALFPRKQWDGKLNYQSDSQRKRGKQSLEQRAAKRSLMIGRFAFLRALLVLAALSTLLIYVRNASTSGSGAWLVRIGYLILTCAWIMIVTGRFTDADWDHDWRTSQYCLVVAVVSLMPQAFHWVNAYGSLSIFVIVQIPTVFLLSKPVQEHGIRNEQQFVES